MHTQHPITPLGSPVSRVRDVLNHCNRFSFRGCSRLAAEARVSRSAVDRLVHGHSNPSFILVCRVTAALEKELKRRIDPRELVAENGQFLTPFVCDFLCCDGCLPDVAYDEFGSLKEIYRDVKPGHWVCSRFPKGFDAKGGVHA